MNANVSALKDRIMETSKLRIGLDVATIVFMLGISFNAGIQYDRIDALQLEEKNTKDAVEKLKQDEQPLSERVARMEAILQDIRDELKYQNEKRTP